MIYLGSAGVCIGLLGIFLFRGYHHDHNIRHEIVEQRKIDFVQSVFSTLRNRNTDPEDKFMETELETSTNLNEQKKIQHNLILPSLNDAYTNAFIVADRGEKVYLNSNDQQLRVPERLPIRSRLKSGESIASSMVNLNDDKNVFDDEFQESRVYATLHALCLHSLVNINLSERS
jgi:hypothetical protein